MNGEQLTLLPAESLASLSVWPGSRQAQQMTVTSGQRCIEYSRLCGRVGSVLRTLVGSSTWHSTTCLLTWHHKVTKQGRSYFQLRASVPRTSERESGSWPTPTANTRPNEGNVRMYRAMVLAGEMTEEEAHAILGKSVWEAQGKVQARVRPEGMWPTPWASEVEMRTYARTPSQDAGKHGLYLQAEVLEAERQRLLPTPSTPSGGRSWPTEAQMRGNSAYMPNGQKVQVHLHHAVGTENAKLNPAWVSRMMGFPDGWMDVGEATP